MRPTTVQHLRFLEHSLTPHDVLLWNACARRAALGARLPVRRRACCTTRCSACAGRRRSSAGGRASTGSADSDAVRLAMPQDEYVCAHTLDEWLESLDLDCVFSVLDERHWPTLYPADERADADGALVHRLRRRPRGRRRRARCRGRTPSAPLDIVYRARNLPFHVGHHGQLKHRIAEIVEPGGARARPAHRHLDADRRHEVRRRVVRVPGQRALRDRHRERLQRARPLRRAAALRGRLACRAPRRDVRGVLGPAGSRAGTTTASPRSARACSRPRRRRPRSSSSRASTTASSRPIATTCRCARTSSNLDEALERIARPGRDRGLRRARLGGPDPQRPLLLRRLRGARGDGRRGARRRPAAARLARRAGLARGERGGRRLQQRRHPRAPARPPLRVAPRPVAGRRRWCARAAGCASSPVPRPVSAPLWRAGSPRSLAFGGTPRDAARALPAHGAGPDARRAAPEAARARRERGAVTGSSTGTPATRCRGRSASCGSTRWCSTTRCSWPAGRPGSRRAAPRSTGWPPSPALKIAFPQDEYNHAHVLDDWLDDLGVDVVFSIYGPEHRERLYPRMAPPCPLRARASRATSTSATASRQAGVVLPHARRPLDLAYRAEALPPRFGRLGQAKLRVADELAPARAGGRAAGRRLDSTRRDAILGDRWFAFVASARAVLGSESGASAIDRRGELVARERELLAERPGLTFEEFDAAMPAGWDGTPLGADRPAPPGGGGRARPRRCWWRATTTACWSRTSTTCPCAPTSPTPTPSSSAWATTRCVEATGRARPPRPRAQRPLRLRRARRAHRGGAGRGAPAHGRRRPNGAAIRRAQLAASAYSTLVVRPPRWAYSAVDRVAPGAADAHPRRALVRARRLAADASARRAAAAAALERQQARHEPAGQQQPDAQLGAVGEAGAERQRVAARAARARGRRAPRGAARSAA